jgi:hypothetical protein
LLLAVTAPLLARLLLDVGGDLALDVLMELQGGLD